MTVRMRDAANALKAVPKIQMRDAGGSLRNVAMGRMRDSGNVLRTFFTTMTCYLTHTSVEKTVGSYDASKTITTEMVAANVAGGAINPVTYAWTWATGGSGITINGAATAFATFTATLGPDGTATGTAKCTATDGNGITATAFLDVTITHVGYA